MSNIKLWEAQPPMYDENLDKEHNRDCPNMEDYIIRDGNLHSCIIVCPGGGYDHRADHEGSNVAKKLNSIGISAVVLNYRVYPYVHPIGVNDAKRAVRYLRYNAERLNIYADKIGIMGFSAGGHLAACVGEFYDKFDYEPSDETDKVCARPDIICMCYPVVTLVREYTHQRSIGNLLGEQSGLMDSMSCENSVREDMPPVFIWHTMEDTKVDCRNSIDMVLALKDKKIDMEYHLFQDGEHGLDLAEDTEGTNQWFDLYVNWLKRKKFCI